MRTRIQPKSSIYSHYARKILQLPNGGQQTGHENSRLCPVRLLGVPTASKTLTMPATLLERTRANDLIHQ
eukprot:scaffold145_cov195-Alexandrium_tamarense.AAC.110